MPIPPPTLLQNSHSQGLTQAEAQARFQQHGPNELPSTQRRPFWHLILELLREPMFILLLAGGTIYFLLGERQDALVLLCFVFVLMSITLFQQNKTEQSLEALKDLTSPRASVIRDGQLERIAGRAVVPDDLVMLSEGDRVPADGLLMDSLNLHIDESLLTGESLPVCKSAGPQQAQRDDLDSKKNSRVFSGTLVVSGQGLLKVQHTGHQTEIGKIGKRLQGIATEPTFLQQETRKLVLLFSILGFCLCVTLIVVYGITRGHWLEGLLAGITLAMSIIPEEFPVVLTVFMALGAWRLSRQHVLTRQLSAIEALGSATVICVDKTGTLTQNRMTVQRLVSNGQTLTLDDSLKDSLPEAFHELVEFSILASQRDPFDPMEIAFRKLGEQTLAQTEHLHENWDLIQEYPLTRELLAMSRVWRAVETDQYVIAAKGAPEAILDLCHIPDALYQAHLARVSALASEGLRVLGVARAFFKPSPLPDIQHDFDFEFLGLIALSDPIRPDAAKAIRQCYTAGLRIVMMTGDYPQTALHIAQQVGFQNAGRVISGSELSAMSDAELNDCIRDVQVFARVLPEQKLRLVHALRANGEIVAMAGDGVNDAPAIKAAHIGLAMGARGTDVAREAADLVLTTDDFAAMVQAVLMGRRIFDNLRKAVCYLIAIHIPIAGLSLLPVFLQWPLILLPVHIGFLQLIIDPTCSVVLEAEPPEPDLMNRPPRSPQEPLLQLRHWQRSILYGLSILTTVMIVATLARLNRSPEGAVRALAFVTFIVANLTLIIRSRAENLSFWAILQRPSPTFRWILLGAITVLGIALYAPLAQHAFHFTAVGWQDVTISALAGFLSVIWLERFPQAKTQPSRSRPAH